jgi:hypothetical protein
LKLTVKEVTPSVGRDVCAERFEISEADHFYDVFFFAGFLESG